MDKTVCFTGHRPDRLGGFHGWRAEKLQGDLKNKLIEVIYRSYTAEFNTFISGGAIGVDQIAAEAVLYLKEHNIPLKLVMALPFPSQHKKWPAYAQKRYQAILNLADQVVYCSDDPYSAWKMQMRNEWMVDRSKAVIAVWNGGKGGTYNCIQYARKIYRPTLLINPYTLAERWQMNPAKGGRW